MPTSPPPTSKAPSLVTPI